jgi:hypothetical protein
MGEARSKYERGKKFMQNFSRKALRDYLEDLDRDQRIILKWILCVENRERGREKDFI